MAGLDDGSGYASPPRDPAAIVELYVPWFDKTATLTKLCGTVVKAFIAAGLSLPAQSLSRTLLMANVVDTIHVVLDDPSRMNSGTDGETGSLLWKRPNSMRFDARPVLASYNDSVWAKDIPLERLCISDKGSKGIEDTETIQGRRHPERMSVPLPSVSDSYNHGDGDFMTLTRTTCSMQLIDWSK